MLPFEFSPILLLRFPALPVGKINDRTLSEKLRNPAFRCAIYFASRELYRQAALNKFDATEMNPRTRRSLLKYLNRMMFRCTPFGMFSCFSAVDWADRDHVMQISLAEKLYVQPDFRLVTDMAMNTKSSGVNYYANPSLYKFGNHFRYLKAGGNNPDKAQVGHGGLGEVDGNATLSKILRFTSKQVTYDDLMAFLHELVGEKEALEFIEVLVNEQLVLNSHWPNVSGESYYKRIAKKAALPGSSSLFSALSDIAAPSDVDPTRLEDELESLNLPFGHLKHPFYVNNWKKVNGGISALVQDDLLQGLSCLERLQVTSPGRNLDKFKNEFIQRYEHREIPLMEALDPALGINYCLDVSHASDALNGIEFGPFSIPTQLNWGPVQQLLLSKISARPALAISIHLSDEELARVPGDPLKKFPPGLMLMFEQVGNQVWIQEAGGVSGTAVAGRFTKFDELLSKAVKEIARSEQISNPDVVFAEIEYITNEHAANINTRDHIREYEIPIMTHSLLPEERIIQLNDLYLSVQSGELVIRSARLNKRIIPRLSTAYNYSRSELPVFRFLCDLQNEGLAAAFSLKLDLLLPGLDFYPRIEYKNCILWPATWILDEESFVSLPAFREFANRRSLPRYFALSNGDQQLIFDQENRESLSSFFEEASHFKKITIREFFMPNKINPVLINQDGIPHVHQLVAMLTNRYPSYQGLSKKLNKGKQVKNRLVPGDGWYYFKLYCANEGADFILRTALLPMIRKFCSTSGMLSWFFIRYYDPAHHLRLRIKTQQGILCTLPDLLAKALKQYLKTRLVRSIVIDTYHRELDRYGTQTMEMAERVFNSSSELVGDHLMKQPAELDSIYFAIRTNQEIIEAFELAGDQQIWLLESISTNLINELGDPKSTRHSLNKKYREFQGVMKAVMAGGPRKQQSSEKKKVGVLIDDIRQYRNELRSLDKKRVVQICSDLMHMHNNRIFNRDQRKMELLIYYVLLRYHISKVARAEKTAHSQAPGRNH